MHYPRCRLCGRAVDLLCLKRAQARPFEQATASVGCLGCNDTVVTTLFAEVARQAQMPEPEVKQDEFWAQLLG